MKNKTILIILIITFIMIGSIILKQLNKNDKPIDATESAVQTKSDVIELGDGIEFRVGKFGPYVTDGIKNVSAKQYSADTITLEIARELLTNIVKKAEPVKIGENPATKKMIFFYPTGRYGAYISSNRVNVSVREMPDLETAIKLINDKAKKKTVDRDRGIPGRKISAVKALI